MALTKYVSAEWQAPTWPGMEAVIKAIGDDGFEYWVPSIDTDVPPWPDFLKTTEGQAFAKTTPPEGPAAQ